VLGMLSCNGVAIGEEEVAQVLRPRHLLPCRCGNQVGRLPGLRDRTEEAATPARGRRLLFVDEQQ
jgi:hypothetical protein